MSLPEIVSRQTWAAARAKLLVKEKEMTRARDLLNAERRRLPMVRMDKGYVFEGIRGRVGLSDLFEARRQLIVYHMMLVGCPGCSLLIDNIGHLSHLHARDTTLAIVSRSPWSELQAFTRRMRWTVPCYSSYGSDFNPDFQVTLGDDIEGEAHGVSTFLRDGSDIFHTYSTYGRGTDILNGTFNYLDLTALGRQEYWEQPPGRANSAASDWWNLHDEY
jgi:predicted dithiol-disulfide oxidoreductase (DUF899 family)